MIDFTPGMSRLMGLWGSIEGAVSDRVSTADLWAITRAAAEAEGVTLSGISAVDMSRLRGMAASARNAQEVFNAANPESTVVSGMIATAPWARNLEQQALAPRWQIRFEQTVTELGQTTTVWRTVFADSVLPATVAELIAQVAGEAEAIAADYNQESGGVGNLSILAI